MKLGIWVALFLLGSAQLGGAQSRENPESGSMEKRISESSTSYTVFGATADQEALLRAQIELMHPAVLPDRITFVPHFKYLYAAKVFRLHVPTGMSSIMFTHLPSRSVFIDSDRFGTDDSLVYWTAHELGHLATNSAKEEDAERVAREYRKRAKDARKGLQQKTNPQGAQLPVRSPSFTGMSIFLPPRKTVTFTVSPGRLWFRATFTSI